MNKKVCTLLLASFLVLPYFSNAQTPTWQWAKSAGGLLYDAANSTATDASGNVYVAGVFESATVTFGTTTLANASTDTTDMFLVKYDAAGNVLWAKRAGGTNFDDATSVTTDASGNVYVTGSFSSSSITFGTTTLTSISLFGTSDIYIVKYDGAGNVIWAKRAGGNYDDKATSVATDNLGNVLVTGHFMADTITFGTISLISAGNYDMFVVKYDAAGTALWANKAGASNDDRGYAVTADASGNVIVAGSFLSTSITIGTTTLNYAGGAYCDIFLAKYDAAGNVLWAKCAGGTYWDEPNSVVTDVAGNIYMAGIVYSATIVFGTTTLTNSGNVAYCEMFIVKYDASGNVLWVDGAGAPSNNDIAYSVDLDATGNVYVVGIYGAPITFGTITLTGGGLFIVKYDASGTVLWAQGVVGAGGYGVAIDLTGTIYVAGILYGTTTTFGTTTLTNAGVYDMFVAKLSDVTAIQETELELTVSVYPNPSNGIFAVQCDKEIIAIEIYNIVGESISPLSFRRGAGGEVEFNLSFLTKGVYFVNILTEKGSVSKKIVLQ